MRQVGNVAQCGGQRCDELRSSGVIITAVGDALGTESARFPWHDQTAIGQLAADLGANIRCREGEIVSRGARRRPSYTTRRPSSAGHRRARGALAGAIQELREVSQGSYVGGADRVRAGGSAERAGRPSGGAHAARAIDYGAPVGASRARGLPPRQRGADQRGQTFARERGTNRSHPRGHRPGVEVSDDGVGGAEPGCGSGLRGLTNRLGALGGRPLVSSPPRRGRRRAHRSRSCSPPRLGGGINLRLASSSVM